MHKTDFPVIFERSKAGRTSYSLPEMDVPEVDLDGEIGDAFKRKTPADLPEVSELEIMRHYTALSQRNYGLDSGFYPLGSCTMKYNPKIIEDVERLEGFHLILSYLDPSTVIVVLDIMMELQ